jgi:hypothetical protein
LSNTLVSHPITSASSQRGKAAGYWIGHDRPTAAATTTIGWDISADAFGKFSTVANSIPPGTIRYTSFATIARQYGVGADLRPWGGKSHLLTP